MTFFSSSLFPKNLICCQIQSSTQFFSFIQKKGKEILKCIYGSIFSDSKIQSLYYPLNIFFQWLNSEQNTHLAFMDLICSINFEWININTSNFYCKKISLSAILPLIPSIYSSCFLWSLLAPSSVAAMDINIWQASGVLSVIHSLTYLQFLQTKL